MLRVACLPYALVPNTLFGSVARGLRFALGRGFILRICVSCALAVSF